MPKPVEKKKTEDEKVKSFVVLSEILELAEGQTTSTIEILREGVLQDRGLEITSGMLDDYVTHHKDNSYGTELQVNYRHDRGGEAAGWIKNLFRSGKSLMAEIEWTQPAVDKIRGKLWKFVSSELAFVYAHWQTGNPVSNVLIGVGLTNIPALKGQKPLSLQEEEDHLTQSNAMFEKYLKELKSRKTISASDIAFARNLSTELSEDQKAGAETELSALDARLAKQTQDEQAKLAEDSKKVVPLSEFQALQTQTKELEQKMQRTELEGTVEKTLILSSDVKTGFLASEKNEVVNFLLSLNEDQRKAFTALFGKVKSVDLSVRGTEAKTTAVAGADLEEKVANLADQLLAEGKAKNIEEAQQMAYKQLSEKKEA